MLVKALGQSTHWVLQVRKLGATGGSPGWALEGDEAPNKAASASKGASRRRKTGKCASIMGKLPGMLEE